VAAPERPATPLWWYGLVVVAAILAVLWLTAAIVGFLLRLVKVAILVILGIAAVSWALNSKADR
jgi:hypothetical protein